MPGTPIHDLIGRRPSILGPALERAREVDDRGQKRSADADAGELRTLDQAGAQFETASAPPTDSSGAFQAGDSSMHDASEVVKFSDVNEVTRQQLMEWAIGEPSNILYYKFKPWLHWIVWILNLVPFMTTAVGMVAGNFLPALNGK